LRKKRMVGMEVTPCSYREKERAGMGLRSGWERLSAQRDRGGAFTWTLGKERAGGSVFL
jgi:hypothetical protein